MATTRVSRHIHAPSPVVFRALVDSDSVRRWMVPDGMASEIHEFDPRLGGSFRISLTYTDTEAAGKTSARTDTFNGRFTELVPHSKVVQVVEFETADPTMHGEMTITYLLEDREGGTLVVGIHENLPAGLSAEENEIGWRMSLAKLAELVESS